jgi:hypothetical protein
MFLALAVQGVVIVLIVATSWVIFDAERIQAIAYGSLVALSNSALLIRRWYIGLYDYHCDPQRHMLSFYRSSIERFVVVGILLALGMVVLKLTPMVMILGFIVGQLTWVVSNILVRRLF